MTPKEKAKYLYDKVDYIVCGDINDYNRKEMALFCVDEVIKSGFGSRLIEFEYPNKNSTKLLHPLKYWQEVKQEIEEL